MEYGLPLHPLLPNHPFSCKLHLYFVFPISSVYLKFLHLSPIYSVGRFSFWLIVFVFPNQKFDFNFTCMFMNSHFFMILTSICFQIRTRIISILSILFFPSLNRLKVKSFSKRNILNKLDTNKILKLNRWHSDEN